jgi:hypothetical protein
MARQMPMATLASGDIDGHRHIQRLNDLGGYVVTLNPR